MLRWTTLQKTKKGEIHPEKKLEYTEQQVPYVKKNYNKLFIYTSFNLSLELYVYI